MPHGLYNDCYCRVPPPIPHAFADNKLAGLLAVPWGNGHKTNHEHDAGAKDSARLAGSGVNWSPHIAANCQFTHRVPCLQEQVRRLQANQLWPSHTCIQPTTIFDQLLCQPYLPDHLSCLWLAHAPEPTLFSLYADQTCLPDQATCSCTRRWSQSTSPRAWTPTPGRSLCSSRQTP